MSVCPACGHEGSRALGERDGYRLETCARCNLTYVEPMPTADALDQFYTDYFKTAQYAAKLASKIRRARRRIRSVRRRLPGRRFIDVGCNVGFAVEAARSLGFDALGIDIDTVAVAQARRQFPGCAFEACSVEEMAAAGRQFDLAYCSEVIEHLPEVRPFTKALRAIVAPGGRAFITTPDMGHRDVRRDPFAGDFIRPPEHLLYFDKTSVKQLLHAAGFADVRFQFATKPTLKIVAS